MTDPTLLWAEAFDIGPQRQMKPLPGEDIDLIQGYYSLERNERYATQLAISNHRDMVALWYRTLTYYERALEVPTVTLSDDFWVTQWRIFRLGICASKAALDALLAGYYVIAFGAIRHLCECWFGLQHLRLFPASVDGYYAAEPDEERVILRKIGERINEVVETFENDPERQDETSAHVAKAVKRTYKRMSNGLHLDGLAIVQTDDPDAGGYRVGATYHPSLAAEGFYHGTLVAAGMTISALAFLASERPDFQQMIEAMDEVRGEALAGYRDAVQDETSGDE